MKIRLISALILLSLFGACLFGCGPQDEGQSGEDPAPKTIVERTVVERTILRTVMEEPEQASDESEAVEISEERPSHIEGNNFVNDSGTLSADVPEAWSGRRTDEVWVFGGVASGPGMTATTDLAGWEETGEASAGTYITASASLADRATDDEILDLPTENLYERCTVTDREDFENHGYTGRIQGGTDCAPSGKSLFNVVASKEGRECVVTVQIGYTSDEEKEQAQRVLDTFEADCEKVSEYEKGLDDYVVEEPEPAPEAAPVAPATGCAAFANQYLAQQYYDTASLEEQALLDPDANGYACDVEILGYQVDPQDPGRVPRQDGGFDDYTPEPGDSCPPGYGTFGDPGTGRLTCLSPEEMEANGMTN